MVPHVKGISSGFEALPSNQLEIFWQKYCEKQISLVEMPWFGLYWPNEKICVEILNEY